MTRKDTPQKPEKNDPQAYLGVAIVFSVVGLSLLISESTRATGIPFMVLGITFFALSQDKPADKPKK